MGWGQTLRGRVRKAEFRWEVTSIGAIGLVHAWVGSDVTFLKIMSVVTVS